VCSGSRSRIRAVAVCVRIGEGRSSGGSHPYVPLPICSSTSYASIVRVPHGDGGARAAMATAVQTAFTQSRVEASVIVISCDLIWSGLGDLAATQSRATARWTREGGRWIHGVRVTWLRPQSPPWSTRRSGSTLT
jgi:hypothetical protein